VPEQLQKVMLGGDYLPLTVDLFHTPQQETPQASDCFDLAVYWFDDRHALGVER